MILVTFLKAHPAISEPTCNLILPVWSLEVFIFMNYTMLALWKMFVLVCIVFWQRCKDLGHPSLVLFFFLSMSTVLHRQPFWTWGPVNPVSSSHPLLPFLLYVGSQGFCKCRMLNASTLQLPWLHVKEKASLHGENDFPLFPDRIFICVVLVLYCCVCRLICLSANCYR